MNKIYCKNCKYSVPQKAGDTNGIFYNTKWCFFSKNRKKENWTGLDKLIFSQKNTPNRNEEGNCPRYKRYWWKFWLK